MRRALITAGAVFALIASSATAAHANTQAAPVGTNTESASRSVYSGDSPAGGRGDVLVTWVNTTRYQTSWNNYDLQADGKGAILGIGYSYDGGSTYRTDVYDHNLNGANTHDSGQSDTTVPSGKKLYGITITECNGGSQTNAQNCTQKFYRNYYN